MGTSNFGHLYDASRYFVIDIDDELDYEDLVSNLQFGIEKRGGIAKEKHGNIGEFYDNKVFGDVEIDIIAHILIRPGYYEDVALDYKLYIYNGAEYIRANDKYSVKEIMECLFEFHSHMNEGMKAIQTKNAINYAEKKLVELSEKTEKLFDIYSPVAYN